MAVAFRRGILRASMIGIALLLPHAPKAADSGFEVKVSRESQSEQQERDVDEVALSSQDKAISRINDMLKKYRGTAQEPVLLVRLAELEQQSGRDRLPHRARPGFA